jgi:VPDSG-CTERM motif
MKTKLSLMTAAVALLVGMSQTLQAVPITGSIDMGGTATLNSVSLGSASAATSLSGVTVGGIPSGSFAGTGGTAVTWNPFSWPSGVAVNPLWTFTSSASGTSRVYSFILNSVSVVSQSASFLNLQGNGILGITGTGPAYDNTAGFWSFTISNAGGGDHANFAFTFANNQTAAVPDGGMTVVLLGAALSGLCLFRKKMMA